MNKVMEEIQKITADAVAKKQSTANNNYPTLIEIIKSAASSAKSKCYFDEHRINEFDKKLLEADGFKVWLVDKERNPYDYLQRESSKQWQVSW